MKKTISIIMAVIIVFTSFVTIQVNASTSDDIIDFAQEQTGYYESDINKFTTWYYGVEKSAPWCAIFVCWCADKAGVLGVAVPRDATCQGMLDWFECKGEYYPADSDYLPQKGDIIFFDTDGSGISHHVEFIAQDGFIIENGDKKVRCIGGNTSDENFNGTDFVSEKNRDIYAEDYSVMGYAHPSYENADKSVILRFINEMIEIISHIIYFIADVLSI